MKKLMIGLFLLLILTGCEKKEEVPRSIKDDFIVGNHEISEYEINTYYLDVTLDEEEDRLYVTGEIIYVNDNIDYVK